MDKTIFMWAILGATVGIFFATPDNSKTAPRTVEGYVVPAPVSRQCYSSWTGELPFVISVVKGALRDPDSFQHIATEIGSENDPRNIPFKMQYGARNGFGGMNREVVSGTFDSATCAVVSLQ